MLLLRSTEFATLYGVRLTSLGPYRLFGYLSLPAGPGPLPAIYYRLHDLRRDLQGAVDLAVDRVRPSKPSESARSARSRTGAPR
jgi:hypothetical protein